MTDFTPEEVEEPVLRREPYTALGSLVPLGMIHPSDLAYCTESGDHYFTSTYYHLLADLVKLYKPKSILEVGVRYGYSLAVILDAGHDCIEYAFAVDSSRPQLWGGDPDAYKTAQHNIDILRRTGRWPHLYPPIYIDLDTQAQQMLFLPRPIDLIYLDADHTPAGVINDLALVLPNLAPGGCIIIDDVSYRPAREAARNFVKELGLCTTLCQDNANRWKLVVEAPETQTDYTSLKSYFPPQTQAGIDAQNLNPGT